jgi:hypothetical protein
MVDAGELGYQVSRMDRERLKVEMLEGIQSGQFPAFALPGSR